MDAIAQCIRDHDLRRLFIEELGWDHAPGALDVHVNGSVLRAERVAYKRGVQVFHCTVERVEILNRPLLRSIERQIEKHAYEHILVYSDVDRRRQVWQWATWLEDRRRRLRREHPFRSAQPPEALLARISRLRFSLEEEGTIRITDVSKRVADTLNDVADVAYFFRNPRFVEEGERLARAMVGGGDEALRRFVEFHSQLAQWASQPYLRVGIDRDDLIQIALLGLLEAARRFDPAREVAFATYAIPWIRQSCQRYVPSHVLRILFPGNLYWRFLRLRQRAAPSRGRGGASRYRECLDRLMSEDDLLGRHGRQVERACAVMSLDSDGEAAREARRLADPYPTPLQIAATTDQREAVRRCVDALDDRNRLMVRLRYGLDGEENTLDEIGQTVGLTKERVRQCIVDVLRKLRRPLAGDETEDEVSVAANRSSG
ncbi:MAG: sigma-70 family RNA polymerase sigma factor [Dehalococcoidia bacterium]